MQVCVFWAMGGGVPRAEVSFEAVPPEKQWQYTLISFAPNSFHSFSLAAASLAAVPVSFLRTAFQYCEKVTKSWYPSATLGRPTMEAMRVRTSSTQAEGVFLESTEPNCAFLLSAAEAFLGKSGTSSAETYVTKVTVRIYRDMTSGEWECKVNEGLCSGSKGINPH